MKKEQIRNELFKIEVLRQRLMRPQFIALGLTVGQGQPRILKELLFEGSMTQTCGCLPFRCNHDVKDT